MIKRALNQKQPATAFGLLGVALAVAVGATAHAGTSNSASKLPRGDDPVTLEPADFSANIDNRK